MNCKRQHIHGWLIVDKPLGLSSSKVVHRVKNILNAKKAGHGGTLDPLATGLLPIALGEATKTVSYVMDAFKSYRFSIKWGASTTTDDEEGPIINFSDRRPTPSEINLVLDQFIGQINQIPPIFSALKVRGERSYKLARQGRSEKLKMRKVFVKSFTLLKTISEDESQFEVVSGKGTYIRSLARDLAVALGTFGHVKSLRRVAVGPFTEQHSISLDSLEALRHNALNSSFLLAIESVLDDIPGLDLGAEDARKMRCGQSISAVSLTNAGFLGDLREDSVVMVLAGGRIFALAKIKGGKIRPHRILNI